MYNGHTSEPRKSIKPDCLPFVRVKRALMHNILFKGNPMFWELFKCSNNREKHCTRAGQKGSFIFVQQDEE